MATSLSVEEMKKARELMIGLEIQDARDLIAQGHLEAGLALMRKARDTTMDPKRRALLEHALAKFQSEEGLLDEAAALVRLGKFPAAASMLARVVAICKVPDVCDSAKKSLAEVRQVIESR